MHVWIYVLVVAACIGAVHMESRGPVGNFHRTFQLEELDLHSQQIYKQNKLHYLHANIQDTKQVISQDLPVNFDGRKQWPECIHPVLDQGQCGSCWSFAASEVLSDRFCIASLNSSAPINVVLSPQNLLSCEKLNVGCAMGSLPSWAWEYLTNGNGITTLDCVPYTSGDGHVPFCQKKCANGSSPVYYKAANYTHVGDFIHPSLHIEAIMQAVLQGPVDVTFNVYGDFDSYQSGIYKHKSGAYEGLHSVKVIGYGVDNSTDYWLVQNSWGVDWGDNGFFKILRGANECGIEELVYTGTPLLLH